MKVKTTLIILFSTLMLSACKEQQALNIDKSANVNSDKYHVIEEWNNYSQSGIYYIYKNDTLVYRADDKYELNSVLNKVKNGTITLKQQSIKIMEFEIKL